MTSATPLSRHDAIVLSALFDPEASLNSAEAVHSGVTVPGTSLIQQIERNILFEISTENPSARDLRLAIEKLDGLILRHPTYASAYNNRAEARRLLIKTKNFEDDSSSLSLIFDDLAHAIRLATPSPPATLPSSNQSSVLSSAYTHRAYLLYQGSRSEVTRKRLNAALDTSGLDQNALEEMASKGFALGGRYSNKVAKQLAVHTNPYAKLCGSIVKEAMKREIEDYWISNPQATT